MSQSVRDPQSGNLPKEDHRPQPQEPPLAPPVTIPPAPEAQGAWRPTLRYRFFFSLRRLLPHLELAGLTFAAIAVVVGLLQLKHSIDETRATSITLSSIDSTELQQLWLMETSAARDQEDSSPQARLTEAALYATQTVVQVSLSTLQASLSTSPPSPPSCATRSKPPTPCTWTVQPGESFATISRDAYGSLEHELTLTNMNRNPFGYRLALRPGMQLLVPSLDPPPVPSLPTCYREGPSTAVFPCLYHPIPGETYSSISTLFYKSSHFTDCIATANFSFNGITLVLVTTDAGEDVSGTQLILPVPSFTCPD